MNSKHTKRALLSSALALVLCFTMLLGTTFAWFTDTASTKVNTIQAGTLDVLLEMYDEVEQGWVKAEGKTLNFMRKDPTNSSNLVQSDEILWEPGCTYKLPELRVVNNGNLALKYKVEITGIKGDAKLNEALEWTIKQGDTTYAAGTEQHLIADATSETFIISAHMKESAGNEYQGLKIDGIAITVYAAQYTYENDSYDDQYDANAEYLIPWDGTTETAPEKYGDGVYRITNAAELVYAMNHAQNKMDGYVTNPYVFGTYVLESNIDLGGNTIKGFGKDDCEFRGSFDGNGFTISNFVIDAGSREDYAGLFNYVYEGTIENLTVTNATVIGQSKVGTLIGSVDGGATVENCTVENCTVIADRKVGGAVGYAQGAAVNNITVKNTTVYCATTEQAYGLDQWGKVIGYKNTGYTESGNVAGDDVVVKTGISVTTVSTAADLKAELAKGGNILLLNDLTLSNWETVKLSNKTLTLYGNNKTISGLTKPLINFYGGTCTINDLTVKDSTVAANGEGDNYEGSGIILEQAQWANLYMNNCHVKNCELNAGNTRVGALVGYWIGGGEIKNCSAEGCELSAQGTVGGIVGHRQVQGGYVDTAKVTNCSVKNCELTSYDDSYRVGAIIGTVSQGATTVSSCTSTGNTLAQVNGNDEINRPADQSELYGRTASDGTITID